MSICNFSYFLFGFEGRISFLVFMQRQLEIAQAAIELGN